MTVVALIRNGLAAAASFVSATLWTKLLVRLVDKRVLTPYAGRKLIHISTAPLFSLTWPLFANSAYASFFAATVPLSFALRIALDPGSDALVRAVARQKLRMASAERRGEEEDKDEDKKDKEDEGGNVEEETMTKEGNNEFKVNGECDGDVAREAQGPIMYAVVVGVLTAVAWRRDPTTYVALSALCFGDGMADVIGTACNAGRLPLPRRIFRKKKTAPGTIACFISTVVAAGLWLCLPFVPPRLPWSTLCAAAAAATAVETLPVEDNITVPVVAFIAARFMAPRAPLHA